MTRFQLPLTWCFALAELAGWLARLLSGKLVSGDARERESGCAEPANYHNFQLRSARLIVGSRAGCRRARDTLGGFLCVEATWRARVRPA